MRLAPPPTRSAADIAADPSLAFLPAPLPPAVAPYLRTHFLPMPPAAVRDSDSAAAAGPRSPVPSRAAAAALLRFIDLPALRREAAWVLRRLHALRVPTVFCHNDLHSGNVMVDDEKHKQCKSKLSGKNAKTVNDSEHTTIASLVRAAAAESAAYTVIDFEYSGPNYRAFDITNSIGERTMAYAGAYPGFYLDFAAATQMLEVIPQSRADTLSDSTDDCDANAEWSPLHPSAPRSLQSWRTLLAQLSPDCFTAQEHAFAQCYAHGMATGAAATAAAVYGNKRDRAAHGSSGGTGA